MRLELEQDRAGVARLILTAPLSQLQEATTLATALESLFAGPVDSPEAPASRPEVAAAEAPAGPLNRISE